MVRVERWCAAAAAAAAVARPRVPVVKRFSSCWQCVVAVLDVPRGPGAVDGGKGQLEAHGLRVYFCFLFLLLLAIRVVLAQVIYVYAVLH